MIMNPQFYKSLHNDKQQAASLLDRARTVWRRHLSKAVISGAVFLILFTSLFMMGTDASEPFPTPATQEERVIIVGSGDTLWGIAGQVRQPSDDIRYVIYLIKERNRLSSTNIKPGQTLIIPSI